MQPLIVFEDIDRITYDLHIQGELHKVGSLLISLLYNLLCVCMLNAVRATQYMIICKKLELPMLCAIFSIV